MYHIKVYIILFKWHQYSDLTRKKANNTIVSEVIVGIQTIRIHIESSTMEIFPTDVLPYCLFRERYMKLEISAPQARQFLSRLTSYLIITILQLLHRFILTVSTSYRTRISSHSCVSSSQQTTRSRWLDLNQILKCQGA